MSLYSFAPHTTRDEAAARQDLVHDLHERLKGVGDLKAFPTDFKYALDNRVWEKERVLAGGSSLGPVSLHEFVHVDYPQGLGVTYDIIERLIGDRDDVQLLWQEVSKRPSGRPRKPDTETVDNIHGLDNDRPSGTSKEAGLRKLQKAAAEGNEVAAAQLAEVVAGHKKVHTACVDAGLRKSTKIDADVKARCSRSVADWIVERAGQDDVSGLVSDLFACGAKSVAIEIKNLVGEASTMDRAGWGR